MKKAFQLAFNPSVSTLYCCFHQYLQLTVITLLRGLILWLVLKDRNYLKRINEFLKFLKLSNLISFTNKMFSLKRTVRKNSF